MFALFMDMRTGKTKTILDEFGQAELDGELTRLLVVAPAGVYRTWEVDAEKHLGVDLWKRVRIQRWESSAVPKAKEELIQWAFGAGPKILLMNIEALSTVEAARQLCIDFLKHGKAMMVVDESTIIKSMTAKRTRFCIAIGALAKRRRILSGLPSPQSPMDLYSQFRFLDQRILGFEKYSHFESRYAIVQMLPFGPGRRLIPVIKGYRDLDVLQQQIAPYSYRVRLEDCYDLPPKTYMRRDIELTKEQRTYYDELVAYATTVLKNTERVTATIVLTQLLRLHQILSGYTMSDTGGIIDIAENKTDEVLSVLEGHRGKAVIWVAYDHNIRKLTAALTKVYGEGSVARFWGGNRNTREVEEKMFLTDPKCRFMLATAAAGGRGRTWAVADLMIYFANTFSLEHRVQSEERTQAIGKGGSVLYVDLVARGTVEEKIIQALRNKKELSDTITGDGWAEWIK